MSTPLKLMGVFAHPDDESMGTGGTLAKYAAEGVEIYLVTATRGERGWFGEPRDYPGPEALGEIREAELRAAARVLGLQEVVFLGYRDGELDQAEPDEVIAKIVTHVRRVRPQVVVTFDPEGVYGHPDHIAICQFATAALVAAATSSHQDAPGAPHQVSKLYYMATTARTMAAYQAAFGDLVMQVDGTERRVQSWPDWAITTEIDTANYWDQVWQAIRCHRTQLPNYEALQALPAEHHKNLWSTQTFYRAFSLVNGGREVEDDMFAGLRESRRNHHG